MVPVVWADSSESNRPDGRSTKGIISGLAPLSLLSGWEQPVSLVNWKSSKIDRACRSSVACETKATVDGEDELFSLKLQWLEMVGNQTDWRNPESALSLLPSVVATDAKGLSDKMTDHCLHVQGEGAEDGRGSPRPQGGAHKLRKSVGMSPRGRAAGQPIYQGT